MAKIDTTKIEGYDAMSAEDKLAALESYEYDDHSGEIETLRNSVTKANGEAADWKRKHHELLSEDERKQTERAEQDAQIQRELEELRQDKAISGFTSQFLANGYSAELAASSAKAMATGDTATVFANAKIFQEEVVKKTKADLLKSTPHPQGGGSHSSDEDLLKAQKDALNAGNFALASHYAREIAERNKASANN